MNVVYEVEIPSTIVNEIKRRGLNPEDLVLEALRRALNIDPATMVHARMELATRYLEESKELVDRDPVQASEKLYKAMEESIKALAEYFGMSEVLTRVGERGRWSVTDLEKAVLGISGRLGDWFRSAWDSAWVLHVWGFHEGKLDSEDVRARLSIIEKAVVEAAKVIHGDTGG